MVREVDSEHVARGEYVITHVVEAGTFDEPWDRDQAVHEVTMADYAPRGPSPRQLDRLEVGYMIHGMVHGHGDREVAIGVHVQKPEDRQSEVRDQLQGILKGGFNGRILVARRFPGVREASGVDPRDILTKIIGPNNARDTRWVVINQGTPRN